MNNVITVYFKGRHIVLTGAQYQYNYGQILKFMDIALPSVYEVHFSNDNYGESKTVIGNSDGVEIPDEFFTTGMQINVWVFLHEAESDGETKYEVRIPIIKRARPTDEELTPVQQSLAEQLIAQLSTAVEQSEANVEHYPKIVNDFWYVWDAETSTYINTNVSAIGVVNPFQFYINDNGELIMNIGEG